MRDESYDMVLAMHMLYHVPDIPRAVAEFRRVLRDSGKLIVSTNSADDEHELLDLIVDCGVADRSAFGDARFCSENAEAFLGAAFDDVEVHDEESTLVVTHPAAVVTSVDSMRYVLETKLQRGVDWPTFLHSVESAARARIHSAGSFGITCHSSVVVCT